MGAEGGYYYFKKEDMRCFLTDEDIDTFVKFVGYSFFKIQNEELVDVRAWEREKFGDQEVIRLPSGSHYNPKLDLVSLGAIAFANPIDEVNAFKVFVSERSEEGFWDSWWWWTEPTSWYVWDGLRRKFILPVGEEIVALQRVAEWMKNIGRLGRSTYLTTWT